MQQVSGQVKGPTAGEFQLLAERVTAHFDFNMFWHLQHFGFQL